MVRDGRDHKNELASTQVREEAERSFEIGRATWPEIALEFDRFHRYFARHAGAAAAAPREAHAADMFLACACGYAIDGALAVFERHFQGDMARAVASIDSSSGFVEEILQTVRERLFVCRRGADGEEGVPGKIIDYAGRASLKSWLCAVAVRSAISSRRRKGEQRHQRFDEKNDRRLAHGGPEFEYLRGRYKDVFEDAVRCAVERLPARERMLLRLHWVDGMSIDKLAVVYKVGRSTAARWLAVARHALLKQARGELHAKLRLTSTELDGLGADMRSQLEISVVRLFSAKKDGET